MGVQISFFANDETNKKIKEIQDKITKTNKNETLAYCIDFVHKKLVEKK